MDKSRSQYMLLSCLSTPGGGGDLGGVITANKAAKVKPADVFKDT